MSLVFREVDPCRDRGVAAPIDSCGSYVLTMTCVISSGKDYRAVQEMRLRVNFYAFLATQVGIVEFSSKSWEVECWSCRTKPHEHIVVFALEFAFS